MKNLKAILMMTIMVMFVMTSCSKDQGVTNLEAIQDGGMIEELVTYNEFVKVNEQIEAEGYEPVIMTEDFTVESLQIEDRACAPCYPWLSDISVYNLGGNNRGFGVNGGRHHPCSYELAWYPTGSTTVNWQNGGFASMTFPGPGTYHICVVLTSSTNGTTCYALSEITITI